jgi:16S rRNA (guanine527-N7)-methyltransferase
MFHVKHFSSTYPHCILTAAVYRRDMDYHHFTTQLSKLPLTEEEGDRFSKNVSRETFTRLSLYTDHLLKWNQRINLIAPSTEREIWQRHILDCAQLSHYIPTHHHILDLGSGAGLPGIVLAILGHSVTLVESDGRKCVFLQESVRICEIESRVTILNQRIESLESTPHDTISARALAPLFQLCSQAYPHCAKMTQCLFPKGRQYRIEQQDALAAWEYVSQEHISISDEKSRIIHISNLRPK